MKPRSTTVGCVLGIGMTLVFSTYLRAFSVGDIVVQSRRGAPFRAEIPLILNQQERGRGVVVAVGDHEEYRAEGIPRPEIADHLEASWITGARDRVLIASTVPVQESTFDLVLSVRSGQVTTVRTYHVGLSAPPSSTPRPQGSSPAPRRPETRPVVAAAPTSETPTTALQDPTVPPWLKRLPERYGPVATDSTLFGIIKALGVPNNMIWQVMVLTWQANMDQFSGGNIHGLRSGGYLTLSPALAPGITTMTAAEAQRIVAKQWDAWQEIRRAVSGQQHAVPAQRETAAPTETPAATPTPEPASPARETPVPDKEKPVTQSMVVLPAEQTTPAVGVDDMQSLLQGLEHLLGQRLPLQAAAEGTATFVNATDLQTALQGLEERLTQQLQEGLRKVAITQQAARLSQQSGMRKQTVLQQMLPPGSMLYVLVVENALLLLLASFILWRWFRSRA